VREHSTQVLSIRYPRHSTLVTRFTRFVDSTVCHCQHAIESSIKLVVHNTFHDVGSFDIKLDFMRIGCRRNVKQFDKMGRFNFPS